MIDPSPAIANLQARWHSLLDPDRAGLFLCSTRPVSATANSLRLSIARSRFSADLVNMLDADPEDLELAGQLLITTNECVRRGKQANARREAARLQAIERKRVAKVDRVTRTILHWLKSDNATGRNAEQIVQDARFNLILAEQTNGLPTRLPPLGMNVSELSNGHVPSRPEPGPTSQGPSCLSSYHPPDTAGRDQNPPGKRCLKRPRNLRRLNPKESIAGSHRSGCSKSCGL